MATLQEFGIRLIEALQVFSPALDSIMNQFTFLGNVEFYLIFIPFIYWALDKRLGLRILLALLTVEAMTGNFKLLFHQPRPYWIGGVKELAQETSYGIPSSHASDSLAVWGYLAYRLKKGWIWILAVVLVLAISVSRLYLGVHFPHDVIFGWLIGAVLLWAFVKYEAQVVAWSKRQGAWRTIIAGFALSLVLILVGELIQVWLKGIPDPVEWSSYAKQARERTYSFTLSGALFGSICGYLLMRLHAPFRSGGDWMKRLGRYILGIVGMLLIYSGLAILFSLVAAGNTVMGYILRYLRYTVVTLWLTFLAPWLFLRIGLAEREPPEEAELQTSLGTT
jgi:membrane-associated phospholipid phosphatase